MYLQMSIPYKYHVLGDLKCVWDELFLEQGNCHRSVLASVAYPPSKSTHQSTIFGCEFHLTCTTQSHTMINNPLPSVLVLVCSTCVPFSILF